MEINEKVSVTYYADLINICVFGEDEGYIASVTPQEALVMAAILTQQALRVLEET